MAKHIFSTLSCDQNYGAYSATPKKGAAAAPAVVPKSVTIQGGHGVANDNIITADGVRTQVDDDAFAILEACPMFARHVKAGFIKVYKDKADAAEVAKDMTPKDNSAPLVAADFKPDQQPTTGAPN